MSDIFETLKLLLSSKKSSYSNTQIALELAKVNEYSRALVTYKDMIAEGGTSRDSDHAGVV